MRNLPAWLLGVLLSALVLRVAPAVADDGDDEPTFGARKLAPLRLGDSVPLPEEPEADVPPGGREYPAAAYRGARILGADPGFVHGVQEGLELLFARRYKETRAHFEALEERHPNTAVGSVAATLVWQAMMLENFDFRYERQYEVSSKKARADLATAVAIPGNDAWERFLLAGVVGIEAIHAMRRERYLPALQLAFEALDQVERAKRAAPAFIDLLLADGMYNYWRTVVTRMSKALPDFGDHRAKGIAQMQAVEQRGLFLGPPTTLGLVFTWLEERDHERALAGGMKNRRRYPANVINNLMVGQTHIAMRDYGAALRIYDEVIRAEPGNARVRYYKGLALLRTGKIDAAITEFDAYLRYPHLESYQKAAAHFRLGQCEYRAKRYEAAEARYREALKINGYKHAKAALDQMRQARKEGRITY